MAVKGKEEVKSPGFNMASLAAIFIFIIGFNFFYQYIVTKIDDPTIQTTIGVVALVLMVVVFLVVVWYTSLRYIMFLTHAELSIDRRVFFFTKNMITIPTEIMTNISAEDAFKGVDGKVLNYSVGKVEGKAAYYISYRAGAGQNAVRIQCSSKFAGEIRKLIK